MTDDLEARLKTHQRAFEGLMSLIPAKDYYGKDESITSTQWTKVGKKQSKAERQAAKRAKLDPSNHKSAKDVMDENERKRKRELEAEADESSDPDMDIEKEKPGEGLRIPSTKAKKQKTSAEPATNAPQTNGEEDAAAKEMRAKARAEKKQQKLDKQKEKQAQKLSQRRQEQQSKAQGMEFAQAMNDSPKSNQDDQELDEDEGEEQDHGEDEDQIEAVDVSGLVDESQSTATPSAADSAASTASIVSTASSSSSMPPPPEQKKEPKSLLVSQKNQEEFRARLAAKLDAMRAARKADGPDGRPAKNRAELIEARRKKEADRKAAKKAQQKLAKEDEERLKAEEQLMRIRGGSGSPSIFSHRSTPDRERNLSFGRVAWSDGKQLEGDLSGFIDPKKRKGKSDPKTALEAAKNKQARLNALDESKRKDIQEKDLWLNAKKRAQGERVHDDTKLLKKSVKRLEKAKAKSSAEWNDRQIAVQKGKEMKQKKREDNLRKRKEEKGVKGKKKGTKPAKKVKKRAGFEGTFKAK